MTAPAFRIELSHLHWLNADDPSSDLCAHGGLRVSHGERVYVDEPEAGHAVSTGALHLLRSVERDHCPEDVSCDQLVPCCGHFMVYDADRREVRNVGCPNGISWVVRHRPDGRVALHFPQHEELVLPLAEWREAVIGFSRAVREFYFGAEPKQPAIESDDEWYPHFIAEWERRHARALGAV
ncbi:MAG: hypothetical protein IPJ78_19515 [Gemmatimonadetes bacterium]|nr:hypothetical protein [Gemmatimonadota bacterium]